MTSDSRSSTWCYIFVAIWINMVSLSFHNYHQYSWIIRIHLHICHHPPSIFVDDPPMFPLICFRPGPVSVCPGRRSPCQIWQTTIELSGKSGKWFCQWKQDRNILPNVLQMSCKCLSGLFRLEEPRCEGPLPPVYRSPDGADSADLEIWKLADSIALT